MRLRIVPWIVLALSLVGCTAWNGDRLRPLAIGVAAAEFRWQTARWPSDATELVAAACESDHVLARVANSSRELNPRAACLAEFARAKEVILSPRGSALHISVRDRATDARCRMTVRYAGDDRVRVVGVSAQVRTTFFQCR